MIVVDYGSGNVGSVLNMLKRLGVNAIRSSDPDTIAKAERLILPGVGAFDSAMAKLAALDLTTALDVAVRERRTPILGICLGMQLLTRGSEEGNSPGFGWVEAETRRFRFETAQQYRVPHMGWNLASPASPHPLLNSDDEERRFYFAHSYHVICDNVSDVLAVTDYGYEFASVIGKGHVMGAQFHPERSHRFGMEILGRFAQLDESCLEPA